MHIYELLIVKFGMLRSLNLNLGIRVTDVAARSVLFVGVGVDTFLLPLVDVLFNQLDLLRDFLSIFILPVIEIV